MPLAASASRKDNSGVRSSSDAASIHTTGRSGGTVASDGWMHAPSKLETAKTPMFSLNHSQSPLKWQSPRAPQQKSGNRRSSSQISKNGTGLVMTTQDNKEANAPFLENMSLAATAAAEAALDAAVSAAMETSDAAAAVAAASADMDPSEDAQLDNAVATAAPMAELPRRSHTTSSQTLHIMRGKAVSSPNSPSSPTTRSLAMLGQSHEHLYSHGHEGHRSHHHRSRSHRNSSRRRRRHGNTVALTGNCWDAAQLHAQLGGVNPPCMVFVWSRPSADAMAAAATAVQAAPGVVLRSKQSSSGSSTVALKPVRWLWRTLHLLAMLHLWPVEEGLALALMFNLPHLRRSLSQTTRNTDGVAVLQEPQRRQTQESAEESEGQSTNERPDSPAIVAAAPCFPYTPSTTGYPAARMRPRYGIMEPH